ncbi:MAG TPA: type II toxin-antitoxin system VapC family toxin [Terriglobales bacterium]|nr:type II toxin-antitoxin system VapC family toxin [Terriglobales bacterium]
MTKYLLDTHIWLWALDEPHRLSQQVAEEIASEENELWLSPISIWELLILRQKGRIAADEDFDELMRRVLRALPVREASLTFEVVREMARVSLPHRDPADHFLVATARIFELTLVTADQHLLKAPGISVLANN